MVDLTIKPMTFKQLLIPVMTDIKLNLVPCLLGDAGIGKSSFIEDIAKKLKTKCFSMQINQLADRSDLTGLRPAEIEEEVNGKIIKHATQMAYPHATIAEAILYAQKHKNETPLLFLDEFNRAGSDITSAILSFITARIVGTTKFPENLRFILAGNDAGNISSIDEASKTRTSIYRCIPDLETFFEVNPNLSAWIKTALTKNPDTLVSRPIRALQLEENQDDNNDANNIAIEDLLLEDNNFEQITVPRTISYLSDWLNFIRPEDISEMMANDSLEPSIVSKVGNTKFTIALMEEVMATLATPVTANGTIAPVKPDSYDNMMTLNSNDDLSKLFMDMSDDEKADLLLYCLYSRDNIEPYITALAPHITCLPNIKPLTKLASADRLDPSNVRTLLATKAPFTTGPVGAILEMNLND